MKRKRKAAENVVTEEMKRILEMNSTSKYFHPRDRLGANFFQGKDCRTLAQNVLGKLICRRIDERLLSGKIVEVECYLGKEDKASHSYQGKVTPRNEPMFMEPGTCYVYFTYGMYHCFNISSEGEGAAVLIRAVEPVDGLEHMRAHRLKFAKRPPKNEYKVTQVCNGPGKLCVAFHITKEYINKENLVESERIWLESGEDVSEDQIVSAKRIGINTDEFWKSLPLRYYIKDNEFVSVRNKR